MKVAGMNIDLPKQWQWSRCSEVIDVRDGTHDTPKYQPSGYPLITSKNLKPSGIDFSTISYISEQDHREISKRSQVAKGDILFAMIGTIGNPVLVETDEAFSIKNVALFKFANSSIDPKYFKYLLSTPIIQKQLEFETRGGTQKFVSLTVLRNMLVPFPSIDEQHRIAAILDKADAVRRKRKESIALTEDLLRSAFLEMFGDPVTNPKGWDVVELASATESKLGKMLSKAAKKGINPVLYLGNSHVRWRAFDLEDLPTMDFSESELEKLSLRNGDLLICEGGEVGRCAIWRDDTLQISFQKAIHRVRCQKEKVLPEYLQEYFFTMAKSGGLVRFTSLATIAHLTGVRLKKLPLPLPPLERQEQFQQVYLKHESLIKKYKRLLETENSLFNSLLQRAFRGDL